MPYKQIKFNETTHARCDKCGAIRERKYRLRLTQEQIIEIHLIHDYYGLGFKRIALRLGHDPQQVKRALRLHG